MFFVVLVVADLINLGFLCVLILHILDKIDCLVEGFMWIGLSQRTCFLWKKKKVFRINGLIEKATKFACQSILFECIG